MNSRPQRECRSTKNLSQIDSPYEHYQLEDPLKNTKYNVKLTKRMESKDLTVEYFQANGFEQPLVFKENEGLGMTLPSKKHFSVKDILHLVRPNRMIPYQESLDQTTAHTQLRKFVKMFQQKDKKEILNVLSLEFSDEELSGKVEPPKVVPLIDWFRIAFPEKIINYDMPSPGKKRKYDKPSLEKKRKDDMPSQEKKSKIDKKKYYPKVQKYCLMSMADSYTKFHVDFGGTSVWYHVFKGKKIFWLIKPTDSNLECYKENYNSKLFFLGEVCECERVELEAGMTFLMPSGWIHAVYTPVDSIVFGGNFLHSFNVPMQERIAELEVKLRLSAELKYPFRTQLKWYLIEHYTFHLTNKSFLADSHGRKPFRKGTLSQHEKDGLSAVIESLDPHQGNDFFVEGICSSSLVDLYKAAKEAIQNYQVDDVIDLTGDDDETPEDNDVGNSPVDLEQNVAVPPPPHPDDMSLRDQLKKVCDEIARKRPFYLGLLAE